MKVHPIFSNYLLNITFHFLVYWRNIYIFGTVFGTKIAIQWLLRGIKHHMPYIVDCMFWFLIDSVPWLAPWSWVLCVWHQMESVHWESNSDLPASHWSGRSHQSCDWWINSKTISFLCLCFYGGIQCAKERKQRYCVYCTKIFKMDEFWSASNILTTFS